METMNAVRAAFKELILPELNKIKEENIQIKATLEATNKRLDDINLHLVDQSRRIDETNKRIDELRTDLTGRIDAVRTDLTGRIDELRTDLTGRIDETRAELKKEIWKNSERIDMNNAKLDKNNNRMDQLFQAIVRREEQEKVEKRVFHLEQEIKDLKMKVAA